MLVLLLACASHPLVLGENPVGRDTGPEVLPGLDTSEEVVPDGTCDPGADAVYGVEGEPLSFTVTCRGTGTADAFAILDAPRGATFDDATFAWTPGLADAGHYTLSVRSTGAEDDFGTVDVWVADAWDAPANVHVDPTTYTEEYGLPVFHLDVPNDLNEYSDVATTMTYGGRLWDIGLKYRGASSLYYPKNSYTVSFPSDDEFDDADEGFDNRRKIVLTSTFDDNSYLRQLLCYELWSALDPSRHQVQTFMAVVYINGDYEGLYLVGDHIDGEYWEDEGYVEDANLYKSVSHDANFYSTYNGAQKYTWHDGYEKNEGPPDDWADIDAFVQFAATSSDADFAAGIESWMPLDEIADWWILVRWTEADDSGGKNAYLYDDPATGLFHHVPWDFNHSLGQTWQTEREGADTNYDFFWSNNLFQRLFANPAFAARMTDRLHAAMAGPLASDAVVARIEDHLARIEPSAERDWDKWGGQYRSYGGWSWRTDWTSHDQEIAYLEGWVEDREAYMSEWYP
jgi:hypothetical protein